MTASGNMFFVAAVVSLIVTLPCSEGGIRPVGRRFANRPDLVVNFKHQPPLASAEDDVTSTKINEGFETAQNAFPFVARLVGNYSICGGVLVHPRYVLTTVTCALYTEPTTVVLGDYDVSVDDGTEQVIDVDSFIFHPKYADDINATVLIKLASRAKTSAAVDVAALVDSAGFMEKVLANKKTCLQLGWGQELVNGTSWRYPRRMKAIGVNFVGEDEMERRDYSEWLELGMIGTEPDYAGPCEVGGACIGDNGGPVVCKKGGAWVVVGLYVDYDNTEGCMYGVKATENVYKYYDWIQSYIQ